MAFLKLRDQPSLVQAIFNGDPDEVRALIFKKEDVNFQICEKKSMSGTREKLEPHSHGILPLTKGLDSRPAS